MSEQTYLSILRRHTEINKILNDDEFMKAREHAGWVKSDWKPDHIYTEDELPDFIHGAKYKYIEKVTRKEYDMIGDVSFCSMFGELKDEYNLSAYSNRSVIEISAIEARLIQEAVDYILLEKYDKQIEERVLKNRYVKVLGFMYWPHYKATHVLSKEDEEVCYGSDDWEYGYTTLKQIKTIVDMFLQLIEEDAWDEKVEYKLIYYVL